MNHNFWLLIGCAIMAAGVWLAASSKKLSLVVGGMAVLVVCTIMYSCGSVDVVEREFSERCADRGGHVVRGQLESRCFVEG